MHIAVTDSYINSYGKTTKQMLEEKRDKLYNKLSVIEKIYRNTKENYNKIADALYDIENWN